MSLELWNRDEIIVGIYKIEHIDCGYFRSYILSVIPHSICTIEILEQVLLENGGSIQVSDNIFTQELCNYIMNWKVIYREVGQGGSYLIEQSNGHINLSYVDFSVSHISIEYEIEIDINKFKDYRNNFLHLPFTGWRHMWAKEEKHVVTIVMLCCKDSNIPVELCKMILGYYIDEN